MYGINDVFDYESDVRNPRKGGVEGALLEPRWHRATLIASGVTALPFVVYLVAVGSPASWVVLAISLFAVVAYSVKGLRFKERPFLDSITSSTHFVSPAVYGLALAGVSPTMPVATSTLSKTAVSTSSTAAVIPIARQRGARRARTAASATTARKTALSIQ
jgi:4-hydroxybenzoate polyprenyltransferase